jgi:UDP-3-O-[3-hydroxymyristoyl] glucosamine N-acyltransferase
MLLSDVVKALGTSMPDGAADEQINAIRSPELAGENDIVFLANPRYRDEINDSSARFVITSPGHIFEGKICIEVPDPYVGYARVAQLFENRSSVFGSGIAPSAVIDSSAMLHDSVSVGPGTVIGAGVTVGAGTRIGARCVIEKGTSIGSECRVDSGVIIRCDTEIGNRVIIQSGVIIGSDGFGNARENGVFIRIPAFGNVIIRDDADIGANTTIDRGNFAPTVIGKGVKLDNLVHIAHNVTIDEHTAIAAQTGISGSTRVGKRVIIAGQAGFVGHIEIGDDAFIGAKAGVSKEVKPAAKITGYPARDLMTMRRIEAAQMSLPQLLKEIKQLRKEVDALMNSLPRSS